MHMTAVLLFWLFRATRCQLVNESTYHKEFPPLPSSYPGGKVVVKISIEFINVLEINEVMGELQFSCFFRVSWSEPRMLPVHGSVGTLSVLSEAVFGQLWRPDIVTENARGVERNGIIRPTIFYGVFAPTGPFYSTYIAMRVSCPFEYGLYPMDVQSCPIHIGSMGLTNDEMQLTWMSTMAWRPQDRATFLRFHHLFRLRVCESTVEKLRHSAFGAHPQKTLVIILKRDFKSAIVQVYLPSILFILIAWLSVLVPPTMLRTRLLLNCTNLLTIISMFLSIAKTESTRVPKVSYVTAMNLWMFVCVAFCFSSVLLVILDIRLVVILTNPGRKLEALRDIFRPKNTAEPGTTLFFEDEDENEDEFTDASDMTPQDSSLELTESQLRTRVAEKRLEWLSRTAGFEEFYLVSYPLLFLLFLVAYFSFCLWHRRVKLTSLMSVSGTNDTLHSGCWCAHDDPGHGCMAEQDYIDHGII